MIDLITIFAAAAIGGILASLLRQPVIIGYLLAGIMVGPFELGLIRDYTQVQTVAELGVTFLLFAIGVEFSFEQLNKVKNISLVGGGLQLILTIALTAFVAVVTGWVTSIPQGIFVGELVSLSSTAVVLKALMEANETNTAHGQVMLGILIIQDLALGLMLAVLPALDQPMEEIGVAIVIALIKLALFALGAIIVGKWCIPPFLQLLAKTESRELFLLGVVTLCLTIALLTGEIGLSTEMGAFVAGLMISEVEYADQTLDYVEPLRDICAAVFFASIGILINPVFLWNNLALILGLVAFVLIAKFLIITPIVTVFRYPPKTALIAALGLAQIGEFSFVLAKQGNEFQLISEYNYKLILGTTALTLIITPFVLRSLPSLLEKAESMPILKSWLAQADIPLAVAESLPVQGHIVVCGYGRVGQTIVKLLHERNHPVLVIEQSEARIEQLRKQKIPYIYGNAASLLVLEKAGVGTARGVAIALPDPMSSRLAVKRTLKLNPEVDLVVRANEEKEIETLYQLGAKEVVQPEFEASIELSTHLFAGLGFPLLGVQQSMQQIRNSHYATLRPELSETELARQVEEATRNMRSQWYALSDHSPLVEKSIEKTYIRRLTGVVLMAINRSNKEKIDYPNPSTLLHQGDNLLLLGSTDELEAFDSLAKGELKLPDENDSCLWLLVPPNSLIVNKTLKELDFEQQFGVRVQAIRRKGQYIRFPSGVEAIEGGDHLLLFGNLALLSQISQKLTDSLINSYAA